MNDFKCAMDSELRAADGVSDSDISAINQFSLKPLTASDVAVFRMDLCNDKVDRHHSRFPHKELETINRMIVGKPLMQLHDTQGRQPTGTFFQSRINKQASHRAPGHQSWSVQPDSYILRTESNAEIIRNIEGGVYRGTSIGFSFERPECSTCGEDLRDCSHWPGEKYDGERCHYIMHDVNDVYEGSIVPLGSQGTEFVESRAVLIGAGDTWEERNHALKEARAARKPYEVQGESKLSVMDAIALQEASALEVSKRIYSGQPLGDWD